MRGKKTDREEQMEAGGRKQVSTAVKHEFLPVYDENSRVLVLGSFPSVKSREYGFYYGHPQNRFWKVVAAVTESPVPETIREKKQMLLSKGIAVWDVVESCEIAGSSDSSIRNVVPADIGRILKKSKIRRIYANGTTAKKLYDTWQREACGMEISLLPSTSPANAVWTLEKLIDAWRVIAQD